MNYSEALEFLRATGSVSRPGLDRVSELLCRLGNPQNGAHFIHVTGTNGKGSVSAMLASILRAAGYRTGLFTSPALSRVNEELQLDGREISDEDFARLAAQLVPAVEGMDDKPTQFERLTAMALLYFQQQRCNAAVLEVGLGGRQDSTNVIPAPDTAVLTNIGLEHTEYLGDTLAKIAAEKGGIIKDGSPVVLYRQSAEVEDVVRALCARHCASLTVTAPVHARACGIEGQRFDYRDRRDLFLPLLGVYQLSNAAVALDAVDALVRERGYRISEDAVRQGLAAVRWDARLEILSREPLVLLDGAHNPNGVGQLAASLQTLFPEKKLTLVMGVMADKDYPTMLAQMAPCAARLITATPDYYRALPSDRLAEAARQALAVPVTDGGTLEHALALALRERGEDEAVCVFGTLYQAGAVRRFFGKE